MSTPADRPTIRIRPAGPGDGETIVALIRGLADYEKLTPPDDEAAGRLIAELSAERPRFACVIAEIEGKPVGYAIFFETYSTFRAQPRLFLEDIFVVPDARGTGAGFALFSRVANEALKRGCGLLEWAVLDWNELAHNFYTKIGAGHDHQWLPYSLDEAGIRRVASMDVPVDEAV